MLKYRKTWYLLIPIMILAACAPKPVEITIEMDEFSFTPNEINLQVGQEVVLYLDNVGSIDHELMIGRDLKLVDGVPVGFEVDFFENAGVEPAVSDHYHPPGGEREGGESGMMMEGDSMHTGFMVMVPPDAEDSFVVQFTVTEAMVGEWELACLVAGGTHYLQRMKGTLTVTP